ncbi:hypothetical protein HYH03_012711 [Edaphochlamys debaryana]|uniref:Guanylate cyclase domain-containing protein n=1 Tax=Edaphochlamys debaryana TaxID=47281 RepID=A0A836BTM8_9CHLO|nr:hypothetical protein HYH03_012711 [Edaphochlamys debaryana]|eukprot:KAG2488711.1 hypothetical protein HYH03_012711 [Edaphochlamys debaryana]
MASTLCAVPHSPGESNANASGPLPIRIGGDAAPGNPGLHAWSPGPAEAAPAAPPGTPFADPGAVAAVQAPESELPFEGLERANTGTLPPVRSNSSFRARLRAAKKKVDVPVTAASLFQWESRSHFWSAIEKAPRDQAASGKGFRATMSRWHHTAAFHTKNTLAVVRTHPSVLLGPLLLTAVLIAGGVTGVQLGARAYEDKLQDESRAAADKAAAALTQTLEHSLQPLGALALAARMRPAMAALGPALPGYGTVLTAQTPDVTSALFLAPFGMVRAVWRPPASASRSAASAPASAPRPPAAPAPPPWVPLGTPVLPGEALTWSQADTILIRSAGSLLSSTPDAEAGGAYLAAHLPVLLPDVPPDQTWGNLPGSDSGSASGSGSGSAAERCPDGAAGCQLLYDAGRSNGTRLWGFVSAVLRLRELAALPGTGLTKLSDLRHRYRLTARSDGPRAELLTEVNSQPPLGRSRSAVAVPVAVGAAVWTLEVYPDHGWRPQWEGPLTAAVVLASLAIGGMLFAACVIHRRHRLLMEAMLPKKVLSVMRTGRSFYERYDNVTVLYADIVRYSNTPAGMPGWEAVQLLNDVHDMYDTLLEKHGLIKIRRSGEAFLGVGGCPDAEDPVRSALRAALCAREMVIATARYRSSVGQRVQIRIGLHSGSVVAAVVGSHMPRFSLFGDTIDISHFMESTSVAMGIHVSDTTAELLQIADDPIVQLHPRGVIDIRGRGPITTFWQQVDLLGPSPYARGGTNASQNFGPGAGGGAGGGGAGGSTAAERAGGGTGGAPAAVECTADLAVAASLGMAGAPLVRKLSQSGLWFTQRSLPGRGRKSAADAKADASLLGSFTLRLEGDALDLWRRQLATAGPPSSPLLHVARPLSPRTTRFTASTYMGASTYYDGVGMAQAAQDGGGTSARDRDKERERDARASLESGASSARGAMGRAPSSGAAARHMLTPTSPKPRSSTSSRPRTSNAEEILLALADSNGNSVTAGAAAAAGGGSSNQDRLTAAAARLAAAARSPRDSLGSRPPPAGNGNGVGAAAVLSSPAGVVGPAVPTGAAGGAPRPPPSASAPVEVSDVGMAGPPVEPPAQPRPPRPQGAALEVEAARASVNGAAPGAA